MKYFSRLWNTQGADMETVRGYLASSKAIRIGSPTDIREGMFLALVDRKPGRYFTAFRAEASLEEGTNPEIDLVDKLYRPGEQDFSHAKGMFFPHIFRTYHAQLAESGTRTANEWSGDCGEKHIDEFAFHNGEVWGIIDSNTGLYQKISRTIVEPAEDGLQLAREHTVATLYYL